MEEFNISNPHKGLHTDNSFIGQPKDTMRFALNAVNETEEGDSTFISNENSNEDCFSLTSGYIPIGQVYIGNNETVIFSVLNDNTMSEIGVVKDCNYTVLVRADLGFTRENQIDATYRLRRGCERVIYWVDPKVRSFNIDRPENFKTDGLTQGQIDDPTFGWEINKFFLVKRYESIPKLGPFEIEEKGTLKSGTYNFSIQYLDESLNPTAWIDSSEIINIFTDSVDKHYFQTRGSSELKNDYKDFPVTNKSIKINVSNLDTNFTFYRLAIIEANNATGQISGIKISAPISTEVKVFNYSGTNFESEGTLEEIQQFNNIISEAGSIEQIENRLVLGNVRGSQVNYCSLQKYASKIIGDLYIRNDRESFVVNESNINTPIDPAVRTKDTLGYMPGEIYSFGIQYYFEDNTISPVYHIPGANATQATSMSTDNVLANTFYTDNSTCEDYWAVDSNGDSLLGENVRHHRFPTRFEAGERFGDLGTANFLGITFSNVEKPSLVDTGGLEIIGYQIVRQERNDDNKTVIGTGVLTPIIEDGDFLGNSVLSCPTADIGRIRTDVCGLISFDKSFLGSDIKPTSIYSEVHYRRNFNITSSVITQDVAAGTSYDPDVHRRRDRDSDGFDLHTASRAGNFFISNQPSPRVYANIDEVFTLNSLETKKIGQKDLYNVQADNKAHFISFTGDMLTDANTTRSEFDQKNPVVTLRRDLSDPYSNFRLEPYYRSSEVLPFNNNIETVNLVNGDSYINNFRYLATTHYDIRLANRTEKSGLWNTVVGVLSIVAGAVLIATGVGAGAGIIAIGFGISQIATGVKKDNIAKVYQELYEEGLRDTIKDSEITPILEYTNPDDEIQWYADMIMTPDRTGEPGTRDILEFESNINIDLREGGNRNNITDFLQEADIGGFVDTERQANATKAQDYYLIDKLTVVDSETEAGRLYKGYPNAEIYDLNPDFLRNNTVKPYFHLGLEYDCCSDCIEEFPHRVHYSEQSFQEELSDNYTSFLPNNYTDIEGEKGVIKDIFRIQNNLYIHTEESLWHLPQNIQERITGDVVSFIGTGSFFSIPPRKILDDSKSSAGTLHKWSRIKTPHGVFFLSFIDKKIYQFTGEQLLPISDHGMSNWFRNNIPFSNDNEDIDNMLSVDGVGFRSVYDTTKSRIIFSKKDYFVIGSDTGDIRQDNSWTISYCLKTKSWISWHSYKPIFYIYINNKFFSLPSSGETFYMHNVKGSYQTFYGNLHPHIIEYVSLSNPLTTKVWDSLILQTEAKEYVEPSQVFKDKRFITFNKGLFYNSRQSSGELNLVVKDTQSTEGNYLVEQIVNELNNIILDRNERDWSLNNIRDIVTDYDESLFLQDKTSRLTINNGYIDKVINPLSINVNKDWSQLESFRDKYLVIRLIFDTFDNVRLITNYSVESEKRSIR